MFEEVLFKDYEEFCYNRIPTPKDDSNDYNRGR